MTNIFKKLKPDFNNDQLKHLAKIFDVFALALLAPILAELTKLKEIPDFTLLNQQF